MPLSKIRDKKRKRLERLHIRLDGGNSIRLVQPKSLNKPLIDADGNVIPEYE